MSFCNKCVGERNHEILHDHTQTGEQSEEDQYDYHWVIKHETLKCCGCETISLRRTSWDSDSTDERGRPEPTVAHFPPAVFRRQPAWLAEFSLLTLLDIKKEFVSDLIHELYVCIQNDCRRSAAMAVRALLEQVMIDKVEDQGTFKKNIAAFHARGFISTTDQKFLEAVIEAGHATMHRAYEPSKRDLTMLVDLAESVVASAYLSQDRTAALKRQIPARKP